MRTNVILLAISIFILGSAFYLHKNEISEYKRKKNVEVVVIDKTQLNHAQYNQSHNDFYYKSYWQMLEWFIDPKNKYHLYLDLKDTKGSIKIKNLQSVLCNSKHDFDRKVIEKIQEVRSHEIAILQLTDLLIGAISYANRYPKDGNSKAKNEIVKLIQERSKTSLRLSTSIGARKFNIFCWEGQK